MTSAIIARMRTEDMQLQSMAETSPSKWHLAHTTWFFETFVLKHVDGYRQFHDRYEYLFNSYYNSIGEQFSRPERGLLSRPGVEEIFHYREYVDDAMEGLFERGQSADFTDVILLGINHEQQHQELILTDIKHAFSQNPLYPALIEHKPLLDSREAIPVDFQAFPGKVRMVGHDAINGDFSFDNESPRHAVHVAPFRIATRPVTNAEYLEFIENGGYLDPLLWLSDGWSRIKQSGQSCPAYWVKLDDGWFEYTLSGLVPIQKNQPVCHVSYYEACAFASWAGCRLPSEFEWEVAAQDLSCRGNNLSLDVLHPLPASEDGLTQMFGDIWEWTSSAYGAYPGFKPDHSALGEYNGKFMCGQYVLRGGSCASPPGHVRATYRNFFYPDSYWQFSGIRLATDN